MFKYGNVVKNAVPGRDYERGKIIGILPQQAYPTLIKSDSVVIRTLSGEILTLEVENIKIDPFQSAWNKLVSAMKQNKLLEA
jgi:hypothetical protein